MRLRRSLRVARLAAAAIWVLTSAEATAESPSGDFAASTPSSQDGTRLIWGRGPEASSCAEASEVEADVVRRLGWNPFSPDGKRSIECHVTREDGVWTATIEERDERGERAGFRVVTSPAESCASLSAAAGLAMALIVRSRTPSPPSPPPAVPPSPVTPTPPPSAETKRELPRENPLPVSFHAAAISAARVLPEPALGASLGGRSSLSRSLSIVADLSFLPEVRTSGSLGEYGFSATWGALGACYDVSLGADVGMSGCVSAAVGAMNVFVYSPTPVEPGARLFAGATIGPRLHFGFAPPVELVAGMDALFPLERSAFLVENAGVTQTVFEQPAFGGLFTLGMGFAR